MVDIHTHILPGIDDGAEDIAQTKRLLEMQVKNGVKQIFLTPHFDCQALSVSEFLEKRRRSFDKIRQAYPGGLPAQLKLGAEVRYSPSLINLDLRALTLGESDYLLLELPFDHYPMHLEKLVSAMEMSGLIAIFAHVERYVYFRKKPELLQNLICRGCLGQVNIRSLSDAADHGFAKACLMHDLAQFVASDTHNTQTRPPCMEELRNTFTKSDRAYFNRFAQAVWKNEDVPCFSCSNIKKRFGKYI